MRFAVHLHSAMARPIERPDDVAAELGYDPDRISKTLLVRAAGGQQPRFCLAVVPAPRRVSFELVAQALGVERVALASPAELAERVGYPARGVCPVGVRDMPVLIDERLLELPSVLIGAGVVGAEVELEPAVLCRLCAAGVGRFAEDPVGA